MNDLAKLNLQNFLLHDHFGFYFNYLSWDDMEMIEENLYQIYLDLWPREKAIQI